MAQLEPVEIQVSQHHPYKKRPSGRGCATCGGARYAQQHLGHATSYNALGSGSQFVYQQMKKGWMDALGLALDAVDLPPAERVLVEGVMCFPRRYSQGPDQGNCRFILEKALGDVLVARGVIADDDWHHYEFGGLAYEQRPGESWTRLMLFPTAHSAASAA